MTKKEKKHGMNHARPVRHSSTQPNPTCGPTLATARARLQCFADVTNLKINSSPSTLA